MTKYSVLSRIGLGGVACLLGGMLVAPAQAASIPRGGTLVYVSAWGTLEQGRNFNPFLPNGSNLPGTFSLLYEPLFYVSTATGQVHDILGTQYRWSDHNLKLTVTTRSGVQWSNGTPFTAKDVAFTFNYIKKYPALDLSGIWSHSGLQSVTAPNDHSVVFRFSKPNTPLFPFLAGTQIVPRALWKGITDPSHYANPNPVGTGPFLFKGQLSLQSVTYVRNPHFWMAGRPYLHAVRFQAVASNGAAELAVLKGAADFTYDGITDVTKTFAARNPAIYHFYWPVNSQNVLYLNTQAYPLNLVSLRRAIAMALKKSVLAQKAYFGAIAPANAAGIYQTQASKWMNSAIEAASYHYHPNQAKALLKKAGFTWNSSGRLVAPNGKEVPSYQILVGAGWTDFITMASLISHDLHKLGISASVQQEPYSSYESTLTSGSYRMAISWVGDTGPNPYYMYYGAFSPQFSASKTGQTAVSDWERYTNPTITAALAAFRKTSSLAAQRKDITAIAKVVESQVPIIPLTQRVNFLDYSTAKFVGWPSSKDPYNGGSPGDGLGSWYDYLNVHLK